MDDLEASQRSRVVTIARTYLGTPYRHQGRVKGAGVDCLTLIAGVFEEARLLPRIDIPHYPFDWHLNQSAERYMNGVLRYAGEIDAVPQSGDIVLWKIGKAFSHGAIIIDWPQVIHAYAGRNCMLEDAEAATWLRQRPRKFFSYWTQS